MDTQTLRNFIKLADTLHFTKTSEQVFMAQPALSRQIKQLEETVGAKLFIRNKRNVSLTKAGIYFKEAAQQTLDQLDYAINRTRQIHSGEAGEIRIGYVHSVMQSVLPKLITEIRKEFPGIKTVLREMHNDEQYRDLTEQKIDIGFTTNPIVPENIKSKIFQRDSFVAVLPVHHPASSSSFNLHDLAAEPFILPHEVEGSDYVFTVQSICLDAGFLPNVVHHTSSVSSALKLVEAGLGVTIEPKNSLANQNLAIKYIELDKIPQKVQSAILWTENTERDHMPVLDVIRRIIKV